MADLVADISEAEQRTIQAQKESSQNQHHSALQEASDGWVAASLGYGASAAAAGVGHYEDALPPPPAEPMLDLPPPPPPPPPPEPLSKVSIVTSLSLHSKTFQEPLVLEKMILLSKCSVTRTLHFLIIINKYMNE